MTDSGVSPVAARSIATRIVGAVQSQNLILFLRLVQPVRKIFDHFDRRIRAALQHVEVGRLMHAENAHVPHRLCGAGMMGAVEGGGIATKEITGHQHFQRAFFPIRCGFHALDHALLDDMEILGWFAFTKDEVVLAVPGFRQFLEDALATLSAQDAEERNAVEDSVGREPGPLT